jgi:hypothetical protein
MRSVFVPAIAVACFAGALTAAEPSPRFQLTDYSVLTMGDKVSGHVGACLVEHGKKPKACFGLNKAIDSDARLTFLVVVRTGDKNCEPICNEGEVRSDAAMSKIKKVYKLGRFELPLTVESKRDPKTGHVTESKVSVGDLELSGKEPGVVVVDLTGEKAAYKLVKVDLPACKVNLADKEHETWAKAIDEAIAELKKKSKELNSLAD